MDGSGIDPAWLDKLTDADKSELRTFVEMESQRSKHQRMTHLWTDICWKKCIAGSSIKSGSIDPSETSCLANCVDRFYDMRMLTLKQLQNSRTQ